MNISHQRFLIPPLIKSKNTKPTKQYKRNLILCIPNRKQKKGNVKKGNVKKCSVLTAFTYQATTRLQLRLSHALICVKAIPLQNYDMTK